MKITRERTVRGKKWFPNRTGSVCNQQEALRVGMNVVSGHHSSFWEGEGGVTAKKPVALTHQNPSARAPTARPRKEKIPKDANTATCSKGSL